MKKRIPLSPVVPQHHPFDWLATLVAVVSIEGRVMYANAALEDVMGVSRRNIEGTQLAQSFANPEAFIKALQGAHSNAFAAMRYDAVLLRPTQEDLPVLVS